MNELPEVIRLGRQLGETLSGKRVAEVFNATRPHRFAFYTGDPVTYGAMLSGRRMESAHLIRTTSR